MSVPGCVSHNKGSSFTSGHQLYAFEQLNYCTRVFNKVTGCRRHAVGVPQLQKLHPFLWTPWNFSDSFMNYFSFILFACSFINAKAPEIVCASSQSTLSAQDCLNTAANFARTVLNRQEWTLSQWLLLLMRTYSLTHSVYNLIRTMGKFQISSSFLYLLLLLGASAGLFTWITPKFFC